MNSNGEEFELWRLEFLLEQAMESCGEMADAFEEISQGLHQLNKNYAIHNRSEV